MRAPNVTTRIIGSTPAVLVAWAVVAWSVYQFFTSPNGMFALFVTIPVVGLVMTRHDVVIKYHRWKRQWDAMNGEASAGTSIWIKRWLAILGGATAILYMAAHLDTPGFAFALSWLIIGGVVIATIAGLVWLARRVKGGRIGQRSKPKAGHKVTVCVRRPVLPVPSLQAMYGRLPEHCQRLFRQQR